MDIGYVVYMSCWLLIDVQEYKSKLILFPLNGKKPRKGDASQEELNVATQLAGEIMPIKPVGKVTQIVDSTGGVILLILLPYAIIIPNFDVFLDLNGAIWNRRYK